MEILVNVIGQNLKIATNLKCFISGSQQFVKFIFNMDDSWDNLTTFAQFRQNDVAYNQYLDANNSVYLPREIGAGACTLILYGTGGNVRATTNYLALTIDENILVTNAQSTEITQSLYEQLVNSVTTTTNRLQDRVSNVENVIQGLAGGAPIVVSSVSEMTDTDQIYVLKTDGKWYYHNGSAWVAGGTYGAVSTDTTLTQSGIPADAEAVGNAINEVKADLNAISTIIESETETLASITLTWEQGSVGTDGAINAQNTSWIHTQLIDTSSLGDYTLNFIPNVNYRGNIYFEYSDNTKERIATRKANSGEYTKPLTNVTGFRFSMSPDPSAAITPDVGDSSLTYKVSRVDVVTRYDTEAGVRQIAQQEAEVLTSTLEQAIIDETAVLPSISIFRTIGVIGDSYSSGAIHFSDDSYVRRYSLSWGQQMARRCGVAVTNYTNSGLGTAAWLTDATYGLPKLLADDALDLYILALGINDYNQITRGGLTLGTIADLIDDYENSPSTFYGNCNKIIGYIKAHAPNAMIVQLSYLRPTGGGKTVINPALDAVADKWGIPYVYLDYDAFFTSDFYRINTQVDGHPTGAGYAGMAVAIERLLSKCVANNPGYFASIGKQTGNDVEMGMLTASEIQQLVNLLN